MQVNNKIRMNRRIKENIAGYLYVMPVIIGVLFFAFIPMVTSLVLSLFEYNVIDTMNFIGFDNYIKMFQKEPYGYFDIGFARSMGTTFLYAIISVPLNLVLSYLLAVFTNQKLKGNSVFRVLYYIPVIMPAVVGGLLWNDLLDVDFGFFNLLARKLGGEGFTFLQDSNTALITFIGMGLFGLGGGIVLWTAQLKNIPESMYEVADIEGAGVFTKFFKITIPFSTPMIFYMLVTGIIGSLQVFASSFLLSAAPEALDFYVVYIYNNAFTRGSMGFACALSWVLFLIIGLFTLLIFKSSKWVFYGEDA